jgi:hypothetical protein
MTYKKFRTAAKIKWTAAIFFICHERIATPNKFHVLVKVKWQF